MGARLPAERPAVLGRVRARRRVRWRRHAEGYLFIAPWLAGFLALVAGPMAASVVISLTSWDLLRPPTFVGLANFARMWNDGLFWTALYNTAYYTFLGVPLNLLAALAVALCLNGN